MSVKDLAPAMERFAAEICSLVLLKGELPVAMIENEIGLTEATCATVLAKLCNDQVLRRNRNYISVANPVKALAIAKPAAPTAPAPTTLHPPAKARRAPRAPIVLEFPDGIRVDVGVPMPARNGGRRALERPWPFEVMKIGHSFEVEPPEGVTMETLTSVLRRHMVEFCKGHAGYQFSLRVAADGKSVRVWRDVMPNADPVTSANELGTRTRKVARK